MKRLNDDFILLQKFAHDMGLKINLSKTNIMIFHSPRKIVEQSTISVKLHGHECLHSRSYLVDCACDPLLLVNTYRYLGLEVDETLSWKPHIKYLVHKVNLSIVMMLKLKSTLPKRILLLVYHALVESHLNYGISIWGLINDTSLDTLRVAQNNLIRAIFRVKPDSTDDTYHKNLILPMRHLVLYRILLKSKSMEFPLHTSALSRYNLRMQVPMYTTYINNNDYGRRLHKCIVPKLRNQLPLSTNYSEISFFNYKHLIKQHLCNLMIN
jgi:hypothetical protein